MGQNHQEQDPAVVPRPPLGRKKQNEITYSWGISLKHMYGPKYGENHFHIYSSAGKKKCSEKTCSVSKTGGKILLVST